LAATALVVLVVASWAVAGDDPAASLTLKSAESPKSVAGSSVATSDTFVPGSTQTMCFTATNGSPDLEYVVSVELTFPVGWAVACNSQDAQDSEGFNVTLVCSAAGNLLAYDDGEFGAGDGATWGFCADVTVPAGSPGPSPVSWVITGDGYGDAPHSASGVENITPVELVTFSVE